MRRIMTKWNICCSCKTIDDDGKWRAMHPADNRERDISLRPAWSPLFLPTAMPCRTLRHSYGCPKLRPKKKERRGGQVCGGLAMVCKTTHILHRILHFGIVWMSVLSFSVYLMALFGAFFLLRSCLSFRSTLCCSYAGSQRALSCNEWVKSIQKYMHTYTDKHIRIRS